MSDTLEAVIRIVRRHQSEGGPAIGAETELSAAGLDSIGLVALLVDLEEEFGLEFPEEMQNIETFRSPSEVARALDTLLNRRERGPGRSRV